MNPCLPQKRPEWVEIFSDTALMGSDCLLGKLLFLFNALEASSLSYKAVLLAINSSIIIFTDFVRFDGH